MENARVATATSRPREAAHVPRAARWLLLTATLLVVASGLTYLGFALSGWQSPGWGLAWFLFDVGREHNVPTWFSSFLWAGLAAMAALGAAVTPRRRPAWVVLAAVAAFASVDEYAELHERLDAIGNEWAAILGWELWFTWVLPALPLLAVVAVLLFPLVLSFPRGQRRLLLLGGALVVGGGVGVESVSGLVLAHFDGVVTWHFVVVTLLEEWCELTGVVLAVGALAGLHEWQAADGELSVRFRGWAEAGEPGTS